MVHCVYNIFNKTQLILIKFGIHSVRRNLPQMKYKHSPLHSLVNHNIRVLRMAIECRETHSFTCIRNKTSDK